MMASIGGIHKFRRVGDMEETIRGSDLAFGDAIDAAKNRKLPGCKCLMPLLEEGDILACTEF